MTEQERQRILDEIAKDNAVLLKQLEHELLHHAEESAPSIYQRRSMVS